MSLSLFFTFPPSAQVIWSGKKNETKIISTAAIEALNLLIIFATSTNAFFFLPSSDFVSSSSDEENFLLELSWIGKLCRGRMGG